MRSSLTALLATWCPSSIVRANAGFRASGSRRFSMRKAYGKIHLIGGGRYHYDETTGLITNLGVFASTAPNHG